MFGDRDFSSLIEKVLKDFSFEEILEMNDLTEEDVLVILMGQGMLLYPEVYFTDDMEIEDDYEDYETGEA